MIEGSKKEKRRNMSKIKKGLTSKAYILLYQPCTAPYNGLLPLARNIVQIKEGYFRRCNVEFGKNKM